MYIVPRVDGLFHLLRETADNSFDEAMAGHASEIIITFCRMTRFPFRTMVAVFRSTFINNIKSPRELVMTNCTPVANSAVMQAAIKFRAVYMVSASVVNALSNGEVVVERDGGKWMQRYERGKPVELYQKIGTRNDTAQP
jgi:DNA gyrase subunit B